MIDPGLVLFAIRSGARLGRKAHDLLVNQAQTRPLYIPLDYVVGDATTADAWTYFGRDENRALISDGGPYSTAGDAEITHAYLSILEVDRTAREPEAPAKRTETLMQLYKFTQARDGLAALPLAQQIIGTIVEIGIDYMVAYPPSSLQGSRGGKVIGAFVTGLDDVDFAATPKDRLVVTLIEKSLASALVVLDDKDIGAIDDTRLAIVLGGVVTSFKDAVAHTANTAAESRLEAIADAFLPSIVAGAAKAVSGNMTLLLGKPDGNRKLVHAATGEILRALQADPSLSELFTPATMEGVATAVLLAVGETPELVSHDGILKELISRSIGALVKEAPDGKPVFAEAAAVRVLQAGLETLAANADSLIPQGKPEQQLLSNVIEAMALGFAAGLDEPGTIADMRRLMTTERLVAISGDIFGIVAEHPEKLLRGSDRKTALAQILGAVAAAVSENPAALATGRTYGALIRIALTAAVADLDRLVKIDKSDPKDNALYHILQATFGAILTASDTRGLIDAAFVRDVVARILPVVATEVPPLLGPVDPRLSKAVLAVLALAETVLKNELNADNLPDVIALTVGQALTGALDPDDAAKVEAYVRSVLQRALS
jgi:hypothetical protein